MISRRNIRVKVMQALYTVSTFDKDVKPGESQKTLHNHFDLTRQVLVYLSYFLTEVCRFAEVNAAQRASKHITSYDDLNVNIKIAGNPLAWKIIENVSFIQASKRSNPAHILDKELIKKIYQELVQTEEYKNYTLSKERDAKQEKEILEFILDKMMLANENFIAHMEEKFSNWDDDGELVIHLLMNFFQKPASAEFIELISKDKKEFADKLLETVQEKNDYLLSLITPKLKNWDPERIAQLDMILMKMGVSEFLYFETIPPKVTINEYIDLAKDYSTPQSGQFVNGILDNIHKELLQQGIMKKVDFKKV